MQGPVQIAHVLDLPQQHADDHHAHPDGDQHREEDQHVGLVERLGSGPHAFGVTGRREAPDQQQVHEDGAAPAEQASREPVERIREYARKNTGAGAVEQALRALGGRYV